MRRPFLLLITLAAANEIALAQSAATHCSPQEKVIFSCSTTMKKVISLCSSSALTESAGYLQYRFGTAGRAPELSFPAGREHPSEHFVSGTVMVSGGGSAYLKFNRGEYSYTVITGSGRGWQKEGVVVRQSERQVAYLACRGPVASVIGPELFRKTKIRPDPNEQDFDVPQ